MAVCHSIQSWFDNTFFKVSIYSHTHTHTHTCTHARTHTHTHTHTHSSMYSSDGVCSRCGQTRQLNTQQMCGPCHLKDKISRTS